MENTKREVVLRRNIDNMSMNYEGVIHLTVSSASWMLSVADAFTADYGDILVPGASVDIFGYQRYKIAAIMRELGRDID